MFYLKNCAREAENNMNGGSDKPRDLNQADPTETTNNILLSGDISKPRPRPQIFSCDVKCMMANSFDGPVRENQPLNFVSRKNKTLNPITKKSLSMDQIYRKNQNLNPDSKKHLYVNPDTKKYPNLNPESKKPPNSNPDTKKNLNLEQAPRKYLSLDQIPRRYSTLDQTRKQLTLRIRKNRFFKFFCDFNLTCLSLKCVDLTGKQGNNSPLFSFNLKMCRQGL